jgi:hypothetical protein
MGILFTNNASSTLAVDVLASDTLISLLDGSKFPSPSGSDYFLLTITQPSNETFWEIVKCTSRSGNNLTVVRGFDQTTAMDWSAGHKAEMRITSHTFAAIKSDSMQGPNIQSPTISGGYTEAVYGISGSAPALSPADGSIQTWSLKANGAPTAGNWSSGQSLTLLVDAGLSYTITWSWLPVTWKTDTGAAPTLNTTGYTVIQLWKVGTVIYGARVGNA